MRLLLNRWSPFTHSFHCMTTSRPAAATLMKVGVSPAMQLQVFLCWTPFLPQPSLLLGSRTGSEYAELHTMRQANSVVKAMRFTTDSKHLIKWMWVKKIRRKSLAQNVFDSNGSWMVGVLLLFWTTLWLIGTSGIHRVLEYLIRYSIEYSSSKKLDSHSPTRV